MANVFLLGLVVSGISRKSEIGIIRFVLPAVLGIPAIIMFILSITLILGAIGRVIFSYLLISDTGLEYRLWPLHKLRCSWDDVEQIKKSPLPFQGDILSLKNAEVSGFHLFLNFHKGRLGITKTVAVIPLYQISGWKNGELRIELEKYAPHLFADQPTL